MMLWSLMALRSMPAHRGGDSGEGPPVDVVRDAGVSCRVRGELDDDQFGCRVDMQVLPVQSLHLESAVPVVWNPPLVVIRVAGPHRLAAGLELLHIGTLADLRDDAFRDDLPTVGPARRAQRLA